MSSLPHHFLLAALALGATILTGCSGRTSSSPSLPPRVKTDRTSPYSELVQRTISRLNIPISDMEHPEGLENSAALSTIEPEELSLLVLSEAYLTSASSLGPDGAQDALLRSAHFAYEGLLTTGCAALDTEPCKLLSSAYRRAVSQIATATSFGATPLAHTDSNRYILDFEGDNDPLSPVEWSFSAPATQTLSRDGIGAPLVGCRKDDEDVAKDSTPTSCVPATFLIHFDAPARDGGTRAHLVAHDAFDNRTINLHGRELPLAADTRGAWGAMFENNDPLVCLGDLLPGAPSVLILVDDSPMRSDWSEIGESLSLDTTIASVYNLCAHHSANAPELSTVIARSLRTGNQTASVVLISQGALNDQAVATLASRSKTDNLAAKKSGIGVPLTVAGTLSVPARGRPRIPREDSASVRSPSSIVAERDIKRLLTRLIEEELVPLPTEGQGPTQSPLDLSYSPVM